MGRRERADRRAGGSMGGIAGALLLAVFVAHACCAVLPFLLPDVAWAARPKKVRAPLGKTISMQEAVGFALVSNPGLGAATAQARASKEGKRASLSEFGPKLGLVYSASKITRDSEPSTVSPPERGTFSLGVEVSQSIFRGFQHLAAYQKAALQEKSDVLALKKARLQTIQSVQEVFIGYLRASANYTSQKEAMERLADQLQITRAYYNTGLKPKIDVLQAEVDLREAERTLLEIEHSRDTQIANINILLGLSAMADTTYVGTLRYVPFRLSLENCIEKAYRQRPDLVMAALSVAIAGKDQKRVQAEYYPHIEGYYNVTRSGNTWDLERAGENGSRTTSWEVGARATWDVFQWGKTYFADKQAGELVSKMRYEENELRLKVGFEIKSKFLALREAEKRIRVAEASVVSAKEAYLQAMARYREQVGTGFDVLETSSKLTNARFSLSSAHADYLTALAQLYVSMGEEHPDILK